MNEIQGERYIEARCEQVWMVVDDKNCRARWLTFHEQITEVVVHEPARRLAWNTQDHPRVAKVACESCVTVELIPEGAGTRVRIEAARSPAKRFVELMTRRAAEKAYERDIARSLKQLEELLAGRRPG